METQSPQQELKAALLAAQSWHEDMGVEIPPIPVTRAAPKKRTESPTRNTASITQKTSTPTPTQAPVQAPLPETPGLSEQIATATALAKAAPTLEALKTALEGFECGSLTDHAQNTVFARGNPQADIMLIGESPGPREDAAGKPFIGPAGQLLDKMFAAINMDESNLYITNVCNWRPPGDRNPTEEELALCAPFITRHMELVAPKIVVIIGGVSLQALTGKTGIMKTRGQWQELDVGTTKTPAMPLYHPAFLLRRPELKKYAWRDLLAIQERVSTL